VSKATLAQYTVHRLAESAWVHSKLLHVVQASTRLPRRCRLAPGSPEGAGWLPRRCRLAPSEGAGWLQAPPDGAGWLRLSRRCRQVSPGVAGAPGVVSAVFRRQVSYPGGAGVVSKWCRLAPGSPEGAGWLQAPQKVQAGSRLPQKVQAGARWCRWLSPRWCR
jgi:hypothetical protein